MAGTLFVVATPIGNLEDLTFRALRILREVDLIACEDTRRTGRLLAHYEVTTPLVSLHEHNERREAPGLVKRLQGGASVALVSDAGTPAISDPGAWLVRLAREAGVTVSPIPGASAITAALSISGLPVLPFTFTGFPPSSGTAREEWMDTVVESPGAVVFFEAPHRVTRTLSELRIKLAGRPIIVNRELTKIHESSIEQPNSTDSSPPTVPERGEFVVVVGPGGEERNPPLEAPELLGTFDQLCAIDGISAQDAEMALGAIHGVRPSKIRRMVKEARIARRRQE